jgi:tetratricopeptide (TPR) repeat protein
MLNYLCIIVNAIIPVSLTLMRIQRHPYHRVASRRRGNQGCLPFSFLLGLLTAGLLFSWGWISQTLWPDDGTNISQDLSPAQAALNEGNLTRAIDVARAVYESDGSRLDALTLLIRLLVYRSYDDYNTDDYRVFALQLTTSALQKNANDPNLMSLHAFALQVNSRSLEAYRVLERARLFGPTPLLAQIVTGLSYGGIGSYDRALREQELVAAQITTLNGVDLQLDFLRALAIAYSDLGRYDEALKAIDNAIQINPRLNVLYFERALYALQLGDGSTATDSYFDILGRHPENVKARLRLCETASVSRDREMALRYCQEVTERAPTWAEGWYKLGREHFLDGDFPAAQEALNRCSTLQVMQGVPVEQRRFECWYLQGQAAEINGDCPALLATYHEFLSMIAEHPIDQTWVYPPEGPAICTGGNMTNSS